MCRQCGPKKKKNVRESGFESSQFFFLPGDVVEGGPGADVVIRDGQEEVGQEGEQEGEQEEEGIGKEGCRKGRASQQRRVSQTALCQNTKYVMAASA
jgi:hypothetical protein